MLELLHAICDHLAAIRAAVEKPAPAGFDRRELLAAIADYFGTDAPFTTAGILAVAAADPHDAIGVALAKLIDLAAPGRAVALGKLLASIDELARDRKGGVLLYRLPAGDD